MRGKGMEGLPSGPPAGTQGWIMQAAGPPRGGLRVPGDKSISHRALILGALAHGRTEILGLLRGDDCLATLAALRSLGVRIDETDGAICVDGRGPEALVEPDGILDVRNSGTGLRILAGLLAARPFFSVLTGDASVRRRPMRRVVEPLSAMGALLVGRSDGRYPPLAIRGGPLRGIVWTSPVASAQVKSALLVAGIQASGETTLREPVLSRDHTERMLEAFGVPLRRAGATVRVAGGRPLRATRLAVPGDLSSAAFLLAAAATRPGGEVTVRDVGVNPTRTGFLEILTRMGADVRLGRERVEAGEPVADVTVRGGRLRGTSVQAAEIPALVDEIPILAVTALFADGETCIRGAGELRVKEVDRLAALEGELGRLGAAIRADGDALIIQGGRSLVGAAVSSRGDHRMAMSLAVAALQAAGETRIADVGCVETSFPGFADALRLVAPECGLRDSARHA